MLNFDYTTFYAVLGSSIVGGLSGLISIYIVFRKRSLIGDVISHATLPGIVLAFLLVGSKEIYWLLLGAILSSFLSLLLISQMMKHKKLKLDAAFALTLSVFFGLGVLLLSYSQKIEGLDLAGIQVFLFGQASSLIRSDVILISIVSLLIIFFVLLFWKEWKLLSFDLEYMSSMHFPTRPIRWLLDGLIICAIVIGLKTVGVILMAAVTIAPAAAARQWSYSFSLLAILSIMLGSFAGGLGALLSSFWTKTPTGPMIIFILTLLVLLSVFFAPRKGLLEKWLIHHRRKHSLLLQLILKHFYSLSLQHQDSFHAHSEKVIEKMSKMGSLKKELLTMKNLGWIEPVEKNHWRITSKGIKKAKKEQNFL